MEESLNHSFLKYQDHVMFKVTKITLLPHFNTWIELQEVLMILMHWIAATD